MRGSPVPDLHGLEGASGRRNGCSIPSVVRLVITLTMLSETKGNSADDEPWLVAVRRLELNRRSLQSSNGKNRDAAVKVADQRSHSRCLESGNRRSSRVDQVITAHSYLI
jgi:hypothetical protein